MSKFKIKDIATVNISSIDKKSNENEMDVRLCNFVDVYYKWAITSRSVDTLMKATAKKSEIDKFLLKRGQVAITKDSETRDDIGASTYIADDLQNVVLGYHCALITPNQEFVDGKYLNAFMHTDYIKTYFENNASGSGQRYTLSIDTINDIPVILPELEAQHQIGDLFSNIDRKIELNREINQNLEAMAKQLYDYWFVQFDFPNEEGKPYKSSGGKMIYNAKLKREIPETWNVIPLFQGVDVQYGFPFSTDLFTEQQTDIPVVRIRDILNGSVSAYSNEDIEDKYQLNKEDLLIGMDGNFHMNYWHNDTAYLNQRSVRLRAKSNSSISIMQTMYDLKPYIKAKEENAKGSTVGHLSDKDLKGLFLIVANETNIFKPRSIFDYIISNIIANRVEIESLTKQRDELLPLLMNGQVEVNSDLVHG